MTRDELIAAMRADGAEALVEVKIPRWGTLYVRPPLVDEIERQEEQAEAGDVPMGRVYAKAAARILCDEQGKRLFDPDSEDDIALLMRRREADLQKIMLAGRDEGN